MMGYSKEKQIGKRIKEPKPLKKVSKKQAKELGKRSKLKAGLIIESGGKCMTCKKKPDFRGLSLSHIVPLGRGGETTKENTLAECFDCHLKFEKHPENRPEWQQIRAGIVP